MLNRFIYALGIRHVGETNAIRLARSFETFEALREAAREAAPESEARKRINDIDGIGEVVAEAVAISSSSRITSRRSTRCWHRCASCRWRR